MLINIQLKIIKKRQFINLDMIFANMYHKPHIKNLKIETFLLKIMQLICEKFQNIIRYTH
jgi:hypothetical protein